MTIYGTPGGTTLNMTPFQGTAPGGPVGATLQPVNPGVGMFPPGSNNNSGDTIMASISRGSAPANVNMTNFGVSGSGNKVLLALCSCGTRGTGSAFVANGGAANNGPAGAGGVLGAAGGLSQVNAGQGEASILPANAPITAVGIPAIPAFRG